MTQLAFQIVQQRHTRPVRIKAAWVLADGRKVLCARKEDGDLVCVCGRGVIGPKTKTCCYCQAKVVRARRTKR